MKRTIKNIFLTLGFGTIIFVTMLILDNGLNDTLKSILIWLIASALYGLSFSLLNSKIKFKTIIHIVVCFLITIGARLSYSYISNTDINYFKTIIITIPIFVGVYIALYYFMKYMDFNN